MNSYNSQDPKNSKDSKDPQNLKDSQNQNTEGSKNQHQHEDAEHQEHAVHESPIKTPKQLVTVIILSFLVPIIVILLLVNYVNFGGKGHNEENTEAVVNKRISPVAHLNYVDAAAPVVYKTGEQVYQGLCISCHASGAAGAPKFGDAAAWSARLGQGLEGLVNSVLNGKGAMAARAGSSPDDYSDYELTRAVVYLANAGGGKFSEPAAPAAAAASTVEVASAVDANASAVMPASAPVASAPASMVAATPAVPAPAAAVAAAPAIDGQKVYEQACIACHSAGVGGAPKFGDKAAWATRISTGMDALYASAIKGKGIMPAKGGHTGSDEEVKAAVDYMVKVAK